MNSPRGILFLKIMNHTTSVSTKYLFLIAAVALMIMAGVFQASQPAKVVFADGNGSPAECETAINKPISKFIAL